MLSIGDLSFNCSTHSRRAHQPLSSCRSRAALRAHPRLAAMLKLFDTTRNAKGIRLRTHSESDKARMTKAALRIGLMVPQALFRENQQCMISAGRL
jgi:hypothetical protein